MRVPRILALLLTATCFSSGCVSVSSYHGKGGVPQKGVPQKGEVVQKGHVHQKGGSYQKGGYLGSPYQSVMHQNLWNRFESSGCCESWDPILGGSDACGVCGGDCEGHTPAQHLKHKLTCASGCGEIYWGEWISDPPDACDPCDDWGNWIGPTGCCGPSCLGKLASGWHSLFGYHQGGKGKGGCDSCGGKGGCDSCGEGVLAPYYDGVPIEVDNSTQGNSEQSGGELVPTPEIEASHQTRLLPRAGNGFSFRSTRLSIAR